ncbi:hypothetical protein D3C84_637730 [compost metagenome]
MGAGNPAVFYLGGQYPLDLCVACITRLGHLVGREHFNVQAPDHHLPVVSLPANNGWGPGAARIAE